MENNSNLIKNSISYGLILGGITVAYSMLVYITGINAFNTVYALLNFAAILVTVSALQYIGTKKYRINYGGGYLRYGRAFGSCLSIGITASVVIALYNFAFYQFVDPDYLSGMVNDFMSEIESNPGISADQIDMIYEKMMEQVNLPAYKQALQSFVSSLIMMLIVSLTVAVTVKKKKPLFD